MAKATSQSRSQRRNYEKFLKKTNPTAYKEWKSNSIERGKSYESNHIELVENQQTESFESMQNKLINDLRESGKSQEEIDRHIAIWVKTIKIWGSNEKPLSWNEAVKEYESELASND